jgi:hypothetical protein
MWSLCRLCDCVCCYSVDVVCCVVEVGCYDEFVMFFVCVFVCRVPVYHFPVSCIFVKHFLLLCVTILVRTRVFVLVCVFVLVFCVCTCLSIY